MAKILLITADCALSSSIRRWLLPDGHIVQVAKSLQQAVSALADLPQSALLVLDEDVDNPGIETFIQSIRDGDSARRTIYLSQSNSIWAKETVFELGVDDYLTKPFEELELILRINALLRRPVAYTNDTLKAGGITLYRQARRVVCQDEEVRLAPREFALLEFLLSHPNVTFSPEELMREVWPSGGSVDALRTCLKTLRRKIGDEQASLIATVHSVGYLLALASPGTSLAISA
jgi:DNA-binding response OmpR family regulator